MKLKTLTALILLACLAGSAQAGPFRRGGCRLFGCGNAAQARVAQAFPATACRPASQAATTWAAAAPQGTMPTMTAAPVPALMPVAADGLRTVGGCVKDRFGRTTCPAK